MEARGRGRGYGRARGQGGEAQQFHQQPRSGGQHHRPRGRGAAEPARGPPQQGAWVRPPQQAPAWPTPQMGTSQQPQQIVGRGARHEQERQGAISKNVRGEGDSGNQASSSRGGGTSIRGRVATDPTRRGEILFTKPASLQSKKGTTGRPINLLANFLPLIQNGKWCLYQYRIDFNPDLDDTRKRKQLVREATRDIIGGGYLFDGTVLYTPRKIANDSVELFAKDGEENIRITIRLVGDVSWGDFHYIQIFNIMIRKCLALMGLQLVGRNYYMPDNKVMISEHKIQLWPGYFTSMRQYESDILLNVDLQFKFMRTDNCYDLLMECNGRKDYLDKIIGGVVLSYYNNKTYRIDDVDFNVTPADSFKKRDGTEITYKEYFEQRYNVKITVRDQPMLVSRPKEREIRLGMPEVVYLVPQLCQLTGLTDRQRDNFQLMKALAAHTRIGVQGRIQRLKQFSEEIQSRPEVLQELRRWDLNIHHDLVKIQGRVLPQEQIISGGGGNKYDAGEQADWTRELRVKPMFVPGKMERLAVICPSKFKSATYDFVNLLRKTAGGMHWSVGNPNIFEIPQDRPGNYIDEIERVANAAAPSLILAIVPNNSGDRYSAIKKKCYVDRGIPSQVFVARNLTNKGVMSIATKVAIQLNCKIGGAPWSVNVPLSGLMVVGYDVCRDTVNRKKSFAGMVASLDRQLTRYFSMTSEHTVEEELSNNFSTFLVIACKQYSLQNDGRLPERIIIYRDGVGDGQLPYVFNQEVESIKNTLKQQVYKNSELKLCYVVVSKRINTRIFTPRDNPPPGTVVDDVITLPESYDFFLVSQCVRQGTVSPTRYNVIYDSMGLPADKIQLLTHKLTHLYYNWSGTVRVPAPCQYAHKLAFLVSQNLHRPAHKDLETLLYYL